MSYKCIVNSNNEIEGFYADPSKANNILSWKTKMDLREMCLSAWDFQKNNKN